MRGAEPWRRESGRLQYVRAIKRAIKQGQTEVTQRGLGKHTPTHSASFTPFSARSFTHQCVCLSFLKPLDLSSSCPSAPTLSISHCTHLHSFLLFYNARSHVGFLYSHPDSSFQVCRGCLQKRLINKNRLPFLLSW